MQDTKIRAGQVHMPASAIWPIAPDGSLQFSASHLGRPCSAVWQMDFQISAGMGILPAAVRSAAMREELSPGNRIAGVADSRTVFITLSALDSKSSTSISGWIAMMVWPHDLAVFLFSWPSTAPPGAHPRAARS